MLNRMWRPGCRGPGGLNSAGQALLTMTQDEGLRCVKRLDWCGSTGQPRDRSGRHPSVLVPAQQASARAHIDPSNRTLDTLQLPPLSAPGPVVQGPFRESRAIPQHKGGVDGQSHEVVQGPSRDQRFCVL